MPIFIPDLFTSYINGRRQAVQDNWTDLQNYNTVLGGQMDNALNMQTMGDRARISAANAELADQRAALGGAMTDRDIDMIQKMNALGMNDQAALVQLAQYKHLLNMYADPQYRANFMALTNGGTTGTGTGTTTGTGGSTGIYPLGSEKPQGTNPVQPTTTTVQPKPSQQQLVRQPDGTFRGSTDGKRYQYSPALGQYVLVQ